MAIALSLDLELKVPAKQYWDTIRNPSKLFPMIMPTLFKSIEIIEGEEGNVGCVRLIKYGEDMQFLTFAKEKVEALDTTNMCVTYSLIEGELLGIFKVFKPTFKVTPLDDNSCIINWSVDIKSAGENFPINVVTEMVKEKAANTFRVVEEHLLAPVA